MHPSASRHLVLSSGRINTLPFSTHLKRQSLHSAQSNTTVRLTEGSLPHVPNSYIARQSRRALVYSSSPRCQSQQLGQPHRLRRRDMATSASVPNVKSSLDEDSKSWHPPRPRKFAPLDPARAEEVKDEKRPVLKGVIFDVDGTLCLPQNYMFKEMRAALQIEKPTDILDHIKSLSIENDQTSPEPSSPQSRAHEAIRRIERNAMTSQRAQPGLVELMTYLEKRSVPKAICTRNFPAPVDHLIRTFLGELKDGFDMIVTRETEGIAPKPSPEGLWAIAQNWGLAGDGQGSQGGQSQEEDALVRARRELGSGLIMVGDSIDDMAAGYRAGATTVLLVNEENASLAEHEYVDRPIMRLDELAHILENGFQGKD